MLGDNRHSVWWHKSLAQTEYTTHRSRRSCARSLPLDCAREVAARSRVRAFTVPFSAASIGADTHSFIIFIFDFSLFDCNKTTFSPTTHSYQPPTTPGGSSSAAAPAAPPKMERAASDGARTKKKHRDVITNRTDEDYDHYEKVVVAKSATHKTAILKALQGHFLFGDLAPSSLRDLVDVMKPRTHQPGEVVIQQGDLGEEFFVLVEGVCDVLIQGVGKVHQYDNVGAFGELALMYSSPRAATIRAATASQLFILDLRTFRMVLAQANENGLMAKVNFLRKVKLLEGLGDNQITKIAGALTEEKFTEGTYIIKQGEIGDAFYIINEGRVG